MMGFIVKVNSAAGSNTYFAIAANAADAQDDARDLHGLDCCIFVTPHRAADQ